MMLLSHLSFLLLLLSRLSFAQNSALAAAVAALPSCAQRCLVTAVAESPCQVTNATCICTNTQLLSSVEGCVTQACTLKEALTTKNITSTTCRAPVRSQTKTIRITNITLGVISALCVLARIVYKTAFSMAELGWDDYAIVATLLAGIPQTVITDLKTSPNGLGKDVWTVPFDNITEFALWFFVMEALYFLILTLLKLTLLLFFLRIFPTPKAKRLIWGTIVFVACWGTASVFAGIFQCSPIRYNWLRWDGEHEGECLNINALAWSNAAISIALDIWMLALPLWQVFQLKMSQKKKISVALMFLVGTFVTAMSIVRLQSLISFANSQNPTWDQAGVSQWSTIEINVGIVCACMPALRIIFARVFPALLGSTAPATSNYYAKYGGHGLSGRSGNHSNAAPNRQDAERGGMNGITYTKTFEVQHGDNDEQQLVEMEDLSNKETKARPGSRGSSEVSIEGPMSPLPVYPQRPR
ncbi:hypothetical protein CC80DRAFT_585579 [Byssothecium circinans]|uniref:CFEM domain-containing protein n=1 Tax=Byssothecium circinans TaxID=147558 RepID=A0A6A5UDQ1_9PLEO|nr:hypothetical protein CC80DRAFT_585579 [Byssothecium circinans]